MCSLMNVTLVLFMVHFGRYRVAQKIGTVFVRLNFTKY